MDENNKDNTFVDEYGVVRPIADVVVYSRRTRGYVKWLVLSIALDLVLSIGLGVVAVQANTAAGAAGSLERAAYQQCISGNEFRAADLARWQYIIELSESGPEDPTLTPSERAEAALRKAEFISYINKADAPKVCVPA